MIIAQISDLHVGRTMPLDVNGTTREIDPDEALVRVVQALNAMSPRPDVVVATGDLTADGTVAQFEQFRERVKDLRPPLYVIPGNHDDRANLATVLSDHLGPDVGMESLHYAVGGFPISLLFLDTLVPGELGGRLGLEQREWLGRQLESNTGPCIIFMHHPPIATGIELFDRMRCADGEELGAALRDHHHVRAIGCGHVHRSIQTVWHGVSVHIAPSASYQYALALDSDIPVVPTAESPACLLYHFHSDPKSTDAPLLVHECAIAALPSVQSSA